MGDEVGTRSNWFKRFVSWIFSKRFVTAVGAITLILVLVVGSYGAVRLNDDEPVTYADDRDHFKYGSNGGERGYKQQLGFGIPYWIWIALPEVFPDLLPDGQAGRGYEAFGMVYEDGKDPRFDMPIGMSMRRVMGVDRVYFTCSVCHTGSVREAPGAARQIVLGMPANTLDFGALGQFIGRTAVDWRFRGSFIMPKISELEELRDNEHNGTGYVPAEFGFIDKAIFKFVGISMMRDSLLALMGRLSFLRFSTWGPGRVDTFNPPKGLLGFPMDTAPEHEMIGIADLPSIWNQGARKGMWLHWDGNNCSVDERNLSAGFGTGATPATLDKEGILRTSDWLWRDAQPPDFPAEHINRELAAAGAPIYQQYCESCHGVRESPYRQVGDGSLVGTVTPIEEIGTDRWRLDSYTPELAQAQNSLYAGYPLAGDLACQEYVETACQPDQPLEEYRALRAQCYPARFTSFRKTYGYANMPLDGLWLRAPYLHNGSVPDLTALLEPGESRPAMFYIGYDVYDFERVGFVTSGPDAAARGWRLDTAVAGNGNRGHDGYAYGTLLDPESKRALIEYLKTF